MFYTYFEVFETKSKGKETDEQPEDSQVEKGILKGQKRFLQNAAQMSKALPLKVKSEL